MKGKKRCRMRGGAELERAAWKSERAQARPVYPQSHCTPPEREPRGTGGKTTDQANVQATDEESVAVRPAFLTRLCSLEDRRRNWPARKRSTPVLGDKLFYDGNALALFGASLG